MIAGPPKPIASKFTNEESRSPRGTEMRACVTVCPLLRTWQLNPSCRMDDFLTDLVGSTELAFNVYAIDSLHEPSAPDRVTKHNRPPNSEPDPAQEAVVAVPVR